MPRTKDPLTNPNIPHTHLPF